LIIGFLSALSGNIVIGAVCALTGVFSWHNAQTAYQRSLIYRTVCLLKDSKGK